MNMHFIHDIIKRSEHTPSLLERMQSELEIMKMHYFHDIIKRNEEL